MSGDERTTPGSSARGATEAAPWSLDPQALARTLEVDPQRGLDGSEVARRRARFGPNVLRSTRPRSVLAVLVDQFRSVVVVLLVAATAVSFAFGDIAEGLAILAVLLVNGAIGFTIELRATRSMEALGRLGQVTARARRDAVVQSLPAEALVPGDVIVLEAGDTVTADARLLQAAKLEADESTLTGESVPVAKAIEPVPADRHLSERACMVFKGTAISRGSADAVVTATGLRTELGRISSLAAAAHAEQTPLEKRLDMLARRLVGLMLVIATLVAAVGIAGGRDTALAIEVAIALAVAAIPEGLPIVATIALARGMWRMARRNALVARLSAVETLGATSLILTDKTGTLTENRMTVARVELDGASLRVGGAGLALSGAFTPLDSDDSGPSQPLPAERLDALLETAVLCNNASLQAGEADRPAVVSGDPTEVALLVAAAKRGLLGSELRGRYPELREEPFDPAHKMMATFHRGPDGLQVAVKGAPEAVLEHCAAVRAADGEVALDRERAARWRERSERLAAQGLRTLAIATRRAEREDEAPFDALVLLGVLGLHDPPREGVREALDRCRAAGIEVSMVTGDHPATARAIACEVGLIASDADERGCVDGRRLGPVEQLSASELERLLAARVVARASPEQKLSLIRAHQAAGRVVAMTGDGVNDAPALKQADIGVAMGQRGTQVAKEAAAMVLRDDEFATIVEAVSQGRAIYANIRKFVVYLMSCNISELLVVALATLVGAPLPLLPLQILFLNLVTDVFPALALGVGEGAPELMRRGPRPSAEPVLTRRHWALVAGHGAVLSASVLAAMAIAVLGLGMDASAAVSVSFLTLALGQLWHVLNMRESVAHWWHNEIVANRWVWAAVLLCIALILAAVYAPGLSELLQLSDPGARGWTLVIAMSVVPLAFSPLVHALAARVAPGPAA